MRHTLAFLALAALAICGTSAISVQTADAVLVTPVATATMADTPVPTPTVTTTPVVVRTARPSPSPATTGRLVIDSGPCHGCGLSAGQTVEAVICDLAKDGSYRDVCQSVECVVGTTRMVCYDVPEGRWTWSIVDMPDWPSQSLEVVAGHDTRWGGWRCSGD